VLDPSRVSNWLVDTVGPNGIYVLSPGVEIEDGAGPENFRYMFSLHEYSLFVADMIGGPHSSIDGKQRKMLTNKYGALRPGLSEDLVFRSDTRSADVEYTTEVHQVTRQNYKVLMEVGASTRYGTISHTILTPSEWKHLPELIDIVEATRLLTHLTTRHLDGIDYAPILQVLIGHTLMTLKIMVLPLYDAEARRYSLVISRDGAIARGEVATSPDLSNQEWTLANLTDTFTGRLVLR